MIVGDFNRNLFKSSDSISMINVCSGLGLCLISYSLKLLFSLLGQCPGISHHAFVFGSLDLLVTYEHRRVEYLDFKNIDWEGIHNYLCKFDFNGLYFTCDVEINNSTSLII